MADAALGIATSGLMAAQTAMDTIAQNLANANTPGYLSESASLTTAPGGGALDVGGGVGVSAISQANDALLAAGAQQTSGALAQVSALQQVLQSAQSAFPEPSASGLGADIAAFWQGWDTIAQNPSSPAGRTQVIDAAQSLVSDFQGTSRQLGDLAGQTQAQLASALGDANGYLRQVASLNAQIQGGAGGSSSTASLVDQRNQVVDQLASAIGAVGRTQADGAVNVTVGGITLVQGAWSDQLQVSGSPPAEQVVATTSGAVLPSSAGTTAGLLGALNTYLPGYQAGLDATANSLVTTVNHQLSLGYTAGGVAGQPLFGGSGAAGITVNPAVVADPASIAASDSATAAPNNGANAQAVAELSGAPGGPDQVYQGLIQQLGDQVQSVGNQVRSQTTIANAARQNLQAATGVDTNSQLVQMVTFQQSYQAAAKLVNAVDTAVQSLLAAV